MHTTNTKLTKGRHKTKTHVLEHGHATAGARVGERDVLELDGAAGEHERLGVGRVADLAARVEQLQQVLCFFCRGVVVGGGEKGGGVREGKRGEGRG